MLKVVVIGLGYVGLPLLCAIHRSKKYETVGYDLDERKIEQISFGNFSTEDKFTYDYIKENKLNVTSNKSNLQAADIYIICVPTPVDGYFKPDLIPVKEATALIGENLKKGSLVIVESTINPGVSREVVLPILKDKSGLIENEDFQLAHCPERINPGDKKWNILNIPRNVGALSQEGAVETANFYRSFLEAEVNEMKTLEEAEATKIIENTFRDINIAYVNELAKSFDTIGIDLVSVIKGASNKPFAFMPHYPGCGVGGHCIPVDPYYLIEKAKKSGFTHRFLINAREINKSMPEYTVQKLVFALNKLGKSVKGSKIALLGLSYKPGLADLRESPALDIKRIIEDRYLQKVKVYEPYRMDLSTYNSFESVLQDSEVVILTVGHKEFEILENDKHKKIWNKVKVVIDGRNFLDKDIVQSMGIDYYGIGR